MSPIQAESEQETTMFNFLQERYWSLIRIAMGCVFLWPFLDRTFGLGDSTCNVGGSAKFGCEEAWVNGGHPTQGFLKYSTQGPFADWFQSLSTSVTVEWLFMIGLLMVGLAFITGMGTQIGGYSGAFMLFMIWLSAIPQEHNPFFDHHLIYAILCLGMANMRCGDTWGLGSWWSRIRIVEQYPFLR